MSAGSKSLGQQIDPWVQVLARSPLSPCTNMILSRSASLSFLFLALFKSPSSMMHYRKLSLHVELGPKGYLLHSSILRVVQGRCKPQRVILRRRHYLSLRNDCLQSQSVRPSSEIRKANVEILSELQISQSNRAKR